MWDRHNSSALRSLGEREQKWSRWVDTGSSSVSARVLARDKRTIQLSVFASLRRLNEDIIYGCVGRVKRMKDEC